MSDAFNKIKKLIADHEAFLSIKNEPTADTNGVYQRYKNPILTAAQYANPLAIRPQSRDQSHADGASGDECGL